MKLLLIWWVSSLMKILFAITFAIGLSCPLDAQTSEDNARLKKALDRFPAADANKDGVLSAAEAKAFFNKRQEGRAKGNQPAKAPQGGEKHVYKTVGEVELPLYLCNPEGHSPEAKAPAMVFFFGGGWTSGSPSQFEHHCKYLASRGMVAITVEYRVSSRHPVKVEDCIEDAKSAMRWVRSNADKLGIDPNRIASAGGSAGGHLAACTAVVDDFNAKSDARKVSARPNAMVLFNPAVGLPSSEGEKSDRTRGPMKNVDPFTYATKQQGPCIMFFGTKDRLLAGAKRYQAKSKEAGNQCQIVTYEGQGHGFFNHGRSEGKFYDLTLKEMDRFLVSLGWLKRA